MKDEAKTKNQLILELENLRHEVLELRATSARFRFVSQALNQSRDGLAVADLEGHLVYVNHSWARAHGYEPEELLGRHLSVFHTPEQMASVQAANDRIRTEGDFSGEIWHAHRDGRTFPTYMQNSLFRDESGHPVGIIGTMRDITRRKEAERQVLAQRDLATALSATSDLHTALLICLDTAMDVSGMDASSIFLFDEPGVLHHAAWRGLPDDFARLTARYGPDSRESAMLQEGRPIYGRALKLGLSFQQAIESEGVRGMCVLPIRDRESIFGGMILASRRLDEVPEAGRAALEAAAAQMGGAISRIRAEETRRQSEEKYRLLAENQKDVVLTVRPDMTLAYVSPAVKEFGGYVPEEETDLHVRRYFADVRDWEHVLQSVSQMMLTGESSMVEILYRPKDGSPFPVEISLKPIIRAGHLETVHCVMRDISARRRTEAALKDSEEKYRLLVENARDAVIVTQDGNIRFINKAGTEILGGPPEEVVDRPFKDWLHPDDATMVLENHFRRLKGEPAPQEYEFRLVDGTGRTRWVWLRPVVITWADRPAMLNFVLDVTSRVLAEKALKESEENYRFVVNNSLSGIYIVQDGRFAFVSPRFVELFGYERPEELLGKPFWELVHPRYLDLIRERGLQTEAGRVHSDHAVFRALKKDGCPLWLEVLDQHVTWQGRPAVVGSVLDVTEQRLAEWALRESEEKFRHLFENMSQGVVSFAPDGRVISCNPSAERIIGLSAEEMSRRNIQDPGWRFIDQDGRELPGESRPVSLAMKTGRPVPGMLVGVFNPLEQDYRWIVTDTVVQHWLGSKRPFLVHVIFEDVTDRRRAEQALRISESRYRAVVEDMPAMICRFTVDGLLTFINNAYSEYFQKSRDEIIGQDLFQFIPEAEQENVKTHFLSLDLGKPMVTYEHQVISPDGALRWQRWTDRALFNEKGEPVEFQSLGLDVTEGKLAEQALRASEEKLAGIVQAVNDVLIMVDEQLVVTWTNDHAAHFFGADLPGRRSTTLFGGLEIPLDQCPAHRCFKTGRDQEVEISYAFPDGRRVDMWCTATISGRHDDGRPRNVLLVYRDMTEKKAFHAEAMRAGQLASIGELAAGVAHEINNPINGIINYAELLLDDPDHDPATADILKRIIKEGERIANIVRSLLSFARVQSEETGPVYLAGVLDDVLALTKAQLARDGIHMGLDLPGHLPPIIGQRQQVLQVVLNLVSNARDALNQKYPGPDPDKILNISATRFAQASQDAVRLVIHDRGTGIPENLLEKVCHPFFSTKPEGEGTGLGLSISHGIVKKHGGRLWFDSRTGQYTDALVEWPVWTGEVDHAS